jgi:outer membrane protein assembly factor BamB
MPRPEHNKSQPVKMEASRSHVTDLTRLTYLTITGFLSLFFAPLALAADWPMWRFDASRTASSPENLSSELHLQWTRQYSPRTQVWDDPLNHDLMQYDRVFEPVVMGERMFVGFNDADKVVALDTGTGQELWAFYTDGPVRFPPVAWQNKVYFSSDDGYLYCVTAEDGRLKWKFRGGPSERKVLGNGRVISAWPARGGPVLRDGRIYFAASIWPFMGVFIHALDAESGKVAWVNDGTGAQFIKQPHSAPSFAGVAPQGALVATKDMLLVPGGRSVPAAFDLQTGEFRYFHINDGGKGNGGSFVAANDSQFFVHTRLRGVRPYDLKDGKATKVTHGEPVLDGTLLYAASDSAKLKVIQAVDTGEEVPWWLEVPGKLESHWGLRFLWEVEIDASGDLIKAGQRLYVAGTNSVSAVELPTSNGQPRVVWSHPVKGEVLRLLAANGKLFAVTLDGRIMAFGGEKAEPKTIQPQPRAPQPSRAHVAKAKSILKQSEVDDGYALWFGVDDGQLLQALLLESKLRIVAVDPDAEKVDRLRRELDAVGFYGNRITLHIGDPLSFKAPPYIAHLVGVGESFAGELRNRPVLQAAYESVRPYGGALWMPVGGVGQPRFARFIQEAKLEQATLQQSPGQILARREGALPQSADWTHQYGDVANSVKSDDARVKAPLGVLWFGGNSNMDVLPRHGHGPPEQVIGGRVFIQGMNSISARDVYTGRIFWKKEFENLGTFGIYYNDTYTNTPLSTAYNQKHIPGANGRGANCIATEDAVYVVVDSSCQVLEAKTGQLRRAIALPPRPGESEAPEWAYIGIYGNILLGGDGFAHHSQKFSSTAKTNSTTIEDFSASDGLAAFDRHTGKLLWRVKARHSFLHNGIVAGDGRVYCLDKLPFSAEHKLKRRGASAPSDYRIAAFDVRTGKLLWEDERNILGTWLGYSKDHDMLLAAGASGNDRLKDEVSQGMTVYRAKDGKVQWQDLKRKYTGPCILHNDLILTGANSYQASSGAFNLLDGTPHLVRNPLTGKLEPWRITRTYGCNTIVASENLLTFRSGAAGYYDLLSQSGTGNLGGFKSGCTANLVVANGVLNAPDYTRTCSCAYQNQTSLALIHMPELEMWTYSQFGMDATEGDRIGRVGINFGAPGDRRADDGTLWLEYPSVSADSPGLGIKVNGSQASYFRRHASQVSGAGWPWVGASGVRDCESITITPEILRGKIVKPAATKDDAEDEGKPAAAAPARTGARGNFPSRTRPPARTARPTTPSTKPIHPPAPYTVRLHFIEPDDLQLGQRVFDVSLQGQPVLDDFDIVKAAGGSLQSIVKEFGGVIIEKELTVNFTRTAGTQAGPILSGIELIAEEPAAGN